MRRISSDAKPLMGAFFAANTVENTWIPGHSQCYSVVPVMAPWAASMNIGVPGTGGYLRKWYAARSRSRSLATQVRSNKVRPGGNLRSGCRQRRRHRHRCAGCCLDASVDTRLIHNAKEKIVDGKGQICIVRRSYRCNQHATKNM